MRSAAKAQTPVQANYKHALGGLRIDKEKEGQTFHSEGDLFLSPGTHSPTILCVDVLICYSYLCGNKVTKTVPNGPL